MERDEFEPNSLKSKSQVGKKIPILNWGRLEIPKLLLIFQNNLKNSQHESCSTFQALQLSCWPFFKIPNIFWIGYSNWKRGQFLENCIFKITLNFVLKLQKLKTPKLYILTRPTSLLWTQLQILLSFWIAQKGTNLGFLKLGFPPLKLSENSHPRF